MASTQTLERELANDLQTLGDLIHDDSFYGELYKSLAGVTWSRGDDGHIALSWKRTEELLEARGLLPRLLGPLGLHKRGLQRPPRPRELKRQDGERDRDHRQRRPRQDEHRQPRQQQGEARGRDQYPQVERAAGVDRAL